jgi:hypothetical protein
MPKFLGSDFQIDLPAGATDESTYAFAFPARGNFRPSVTVKTHRLPGPVALESHVEEQLGHIRAALPDMNVVVRGAASEDGGAYEAVYDFGDPGQRVRQRQRYLLLPEPWRVVTLTATGLAEGFAEVASLFEAVFRSFLPGVPGPRSS